jgi:hypothetical protein
MSEPSLRNNGLWSPLVAENVDETCDRFEVAWKAAGATIERPRIALTQGGRRECSTQCGGLFDRLVMYLVERTSVRRTCALAAGA